MWNSGFMTLGWGTSRCATHFRGPVTASATITPDGNEAHELWQRHRPAGADAADAVPARAHLRGVRGRAVRGRRRRRRDRRCRGRAAADSAVRERKSTRLNSSHLVISYAVFCLKKKKKIKTDTTKHRPILHS